MFALPISNASGLKLNIGCSDAHMAGYVNVDRCPPADLIADLTKRWPWDDSSVSSVKAWDIFEHLPDIRHTMNEAYRVLEPGGELDLLVPTTDGRGAFQDPTHVSYWNENSLFYFVDSCAEWQRFHVAYNITARFRVRLQAHCEYPGKVWKLHAVLKPVKL